MNNLHDAVLVCDDLTRIYEEGPHQLEVLSGINLRIERGEMVAVVGASGSGKSTLLNLLGGLDSPTRGSVSVCGTRLDGLSEKQLCQLRNRSVGFIYQFHHLLPEFTALENVVMPLLIGGATPGEAIGKAERLLGQVGLAARLEHKPGMLSGGERQRVAIARALVTSPALVLADEPTGNLDEKTADVVLAEFLRLVRGEGSAALIATHNERLAAKMDRVVRLHEGVLE